MFSRLRTRIVRLLFYVLVQAFGVYVRVYTQNAVDGSKQKQDNERVPSTKNEISINWMTLTCCVGGSDSNDELLADVVGVNFRGAGLGGEAEKFELVEIGEDLTPV